MSQDTHCAYTIFYWSTHRELTRRDIPSAAADAQPTLAIGQSQRPLGCLTRRKCAFGVGSAAATGSDACRAHFASAKGFTPGVRADLRPKAVPIIDGGAAVGAASLSLFARGRFLEARRLKSEVRPFCSLTGPCATLSYSQHFERGSSGCPRARRCRKAMVQTFSSVCCRPPH